MKFEPEKAAQNREKHGIPFDAAADVRLSPHVTERSDRKGKSGGSPPVPLEGRLITVVYTRRGEAIRITSFAARQEK